MFSCAKPQDFEYVDFQNPRVLDLGIKESTVGADVRFFNPNNYQLQLKEAELDVHINNHYLGKTDLDTLIRIPRSDTFTIPVVLKVKSLSAISSIFQTLTDSAVLVKLQGKVKMGKAGVFLNYDINYEGLQRVKF